MPLIPCLLASLACQTVVGLWQAPPTPTWTPSSTPQPPTVTPTFTPTSTPVPASPTPSPTATPLPPSPTPTATATITLSLQPTPSAVQFEVFEQLWQIVNEGYLYPDFNGLDWNGVYDEYSQRIEAGLTDEAFYQAMVEMIEQLGDEHSVFLDPEQAARLDAEYTGEVDYVGIGVMTSLVPERERATILLVFPGSPADQAGLKIHDSILAVDGYPIIDDSGFRRDLLLGPEGTTIELTVQSPGEAAREVRVTRQRINSGRPVPYELLETPSGKRVGYIILTTFNDSTVDDQVQIALEALSEGGQLDGLILDNRMNGGGTSDVLADTLSYFTQGTVGYFIRRESSEELQVRARDIRGSQNMPLVVLIDTDTASFGEIFAGLLKDLGRAYLIGEQTEGNVEILSIFNFTDGSRAWIAQQTFRPLNNPNQDWEQTGIIPDQVVNTDWDLITLGTDPAVDASLNYFDSLLR